MDKITIKSPEEVAIMHEAGKKLAVVKKGLKKAVKEGVSALEIENLANELIKKEGAVSSFKKVPGYSWATCININDGIVHGIPKKEMVFKDGDVVSVDVGLFYKGFHSDTSFSTVIGSHTELEKMMENGKEALKNAIKQAKTGKTIRDIAQATEGTLKKHGFEPIRALVGHGIGKNLHEEPMIPCYVSGAASESIRIEPGMVLAIEVMYTQGSEKVVLDDDGWTIKTRDGRISALFEETVAVTKNGPIILTE